MEMEIFNFHGSLLVFWAIVFIVAFVIVYFVARKGLLKGWLDDSEKDIQEELNEMTPHIKK